MFQLYYSNYLQMRRIDESEQEFLSLYKHSLKLHQYGWLEIHPELNTLPYANKHMCLESYGKEKAYAQLTETFRNREILLLLEGVTIKVKCEHDLIHCSLEKIYNTFG